MKSRKETRKYVFGPVASRRLGKSLGVDLVYHKVCSLDCIYCECGATTMKTSERQIYIPTDAIRQELLEVLPEIACDCDAITFSGSGEPTLAANLGEIASIIKTLSGKPLVLLTNGTLLHRDDVISDIQAIDIVIPSLDAANEEIFHKINRPDGALNFDRYLMGLRNLHLKYKGRIWLEILLCRGVNDSPGHLLELALEVQRIRPELVQLNTLARPGTEADIRGLSHDEMLSAVETMGIEAHVFSSQIMSRCSNECQQDSELLNRICEIVKRRPCTAVILAESLNVSESTIERILRCAMIEGTLSETELEGKKFYRKLEGFKNAQI